VHVQPKYFNFSSNMTRIFHLFTCLLITFCLCQCESKKSVDTYTKKKVLLIGNASEPQGLDPQVVTGVVESKIIRGLFEGLCVEDPINASNHRPGAALSWESSNNNTEWVFKLRPEGKWSDGTKLTAQDFIFSYNRILNPKFGAKYSSMLYFLKGAEEYNKNQRELFLFKDNPEYQAQWAVIEKINFNGDSETKAGDLPGSEFNEFNKEEKQRYIKSLGLNNISKKQLQAVEKDNDLTNFPAELDAATRSKILNSLIDNSGKDLWSIANVGVTAVDDYTLKFVLKSPTPFFPDLTKHYTYFPVPQHVIKRYGKVDVQNYIWTEPDKIVSNGPFKMKDWKFNFFIELERNLYYWDAKNVKLNGIRFLPVSNPYTEARMFFHGELHVTDTLAAELIEYSQEKFPENVRQETYLGTNFLRFNATQDTFKDVNLRKALAYSINSKAIIDHILKGGQKVATGVVPPMGDYKTAKGLEFNPAKAKEYFSKTKFADSPQKLKITLLTTDKDSAKVLAEAMQDMWKTHLGINVRIEQRDWKTYLDKMSKFDYGIATGGWIGDYPDPTTFLDIWKKGDGNNRTGWSSQAFEAKLALAEKAGSAQERLDLLQEAEAIMLDEMPIMPLYWYSSNYLTSKDVKGWYPSIMKNQPYKFLDLQR